ncbi:MAG: hypothetical protein KDB40_03995 [Acidimicrobiales bacterium]|nr:hypothetical protein [Acidimicrobiales bacterium]MCB9393543.1 alkaline phosphatase family protein [Acidimicrobiaceae bacterium]
MRESRSSQLLLGPMLRYVGADEATVWVETDARARVEVRAAASGAVLGSTTTFAVHGHHYGLVVIDSLVAFADGDGTDESVGIAYEVVVDDEVRWPVPGSAMPPSLIRPVRSGAPIRVAFGSCRAAAPHEPPYTHRLDDHPDGKGVDALRAFGLRMAQQHPGEWPHLLLLAGDQVYADDSSPSTTRRIEHRRRTGVAADAPTGVVADFEEYTWLYHESWTPEIERWLLSTVPSAMIFDDHDMIDDWNISASWVSDIRATSWWPDHVVGGLVSYWLYQHLGNLSPARLRDEGLLQRCIDAGDASDLLHRWALESEEFTPLPGGYQFSFDRHLGDTHLVVMDVRNGRVLEPGARRMLDDEEWRWVRERTLEPACHLVLASSLPVFVPGGLHGIQQWNEAVCDGAWGRMSARAGERLRRAIDLEGWPAFDRSFRDLELLLTELTADHEAPCSVWVVGGDIHFGYLAEVDVPGAASGCTVTQVVCSPLRNVLQSRDRQVMRFGASRVGRRIGRWLSRSVRRGRTELRWALSDGPVFDNNIGSFRFDGDEADVRIEVATLDADGHEVLVPRIERRVAGRSAATINSG